MIYKVPINFNLHVIVSIMIVDWAIFVFNRRLWAERVRHASVYITFLKKIK